MEELTKFQDKLLTLANLKYMQMEYNFYDDYMDLPILTLMCMNAWFSKYVRSYVKLILY